MNKKQADYNRNKALFEANSTVTFASREELIEFFSNYVADQYKDYLTGNSAISVALTTRRLRAEPNLVRLIVEGYLQPIVPATDGKLLNIKKCLKLSLPEIIIGTDDDYNGLYKAIVESINQGDVVDQVFPQNLLFIIEGDVILRKEQK